MLRLFHERFQNGFSIIDRCILGKTNVLDRVNYKSINNVNEELFFSAGQTVTVVAYYSVNSASRRVMDRIQRTSISLFLSWMNKVKREIVKMKLKKRAKTIPYETA
jgi:hypothetical protein